MGLLLVTRPAAWKIRQGAPFTLPPKLSHAPTLLPLTPSHPAHWLTSGSRPSFPGT